MSKLNSAMTFVEQSRSYNEWKGEDWSEEKDWYARKMKDGTAGAYPLWFLLGGTSPSLFRGQNQRYQPCLPSLARGLSLIDESMANWSLDDQTEYIIRSVKSRWFRDEMGYHPLIEHARIRNMYVNKVALAQHYGLPTSYIDLTHSWDVASFFATCRLVDGVWEPVSEGQGVFYLVVPDHEMTEQICFMPLPRPSEQKGWVVDNPLDITFEGWKNVQVADFQHDSRAGTYFLEMFDGGKALFPPDPMAEIAKIIMDADELPIDHVEGTIQAHVDGSIGLTSERSSLVKALIEKRFTITSCAERLLSERLIHKYKDSIQRQVEKIDNIRLRVRKVKSE